MRYNEPDIKITRFDRETVATGAAQPTLAPVSGNFNSASNDLINMFEVYSEAAGEVLVYKW